MTEAKEKPGRASLGDLRAMKKRGEIRAPRADAPSFDVPAEFWENARPYAPAKKSVHLRVDEDVFEFFQAQGKGHLTRMNAVLRSYVEAQRRPTPRKQSRSRG
jgi:uncharacterized protein (DUF4415 family)